MATTNAYTFSSTSEAPVSFPIGASALIGIDKEGTVDPTFITIAADMTLVFSAAKTVTEIAAAMTAWLAAHGHGARGAAGGEQASGVPGRTPVTETAVAVAA